MTKIEKTLPETSKMIQIDSTVIAAPGQSQFKDHCHLVQWTELFDMVTVDALYLRGRGKMGYLDRRIKAPNTTDPSYNK